MEAQLGRRGDSLVVRVVVAWKKIVFGLVSMVCSCPHLALIIFYVQRLNEKVSLDTCSYACT